MGGLFGSKPDNSAQKEAEAKAAAKEAQLASELSSRRRASGQSGNSSKTLFKAVEGNASATKKKTTLGG